MSMNVEDCSINRPARSIPDIPTNVIDQFNMDGKVCVITGGNRGIGYAVAQGFVEAGGNVVLVFSSESPSNDEKIALLAEQRRTKVVGRRCNVADAAAVETLILNIVSEFGKIDVFVANAGICIPKSILEQTLEEYHAQMNVNVHGVVYCAKNVGIVFRRQGYGNFIITSSIAASVVMVPTDHTTYNTTKAAVSMLGKSLAREWRDFARVNMVCPGYINTDMSGDQSAINEAHRMASMGRQADVKELKAIYLYLASNASTFVTGAEFVIDGGYTLP